jgi:predicted dehydrogenase
MKVDENKTHGVAILGCGDMGRGHARAWNDRPDARVTAVFDVDTARAQALAADTGAEVHDSWQAAIEADGVDMVSVCTPICFHAEMAIHAARCGRHVLCEKAMALTLTDADAMIAAAAAASVKLAIAYQHRAFPVHRTWQSLIRRNLLGGPLFIRMEDVRGIRPKTAMHRRGMNGGPVIDMAGHFFDLVRYYTGAEPMRVTAHGHCFGRSKPELSSFQDLAIDAAEILVEYSGGHVLSANLNWGLPAGHPGSTRMCISSPEVVSVPLDNRISVRHKDREELYDPVPGIEGTAKRIDDLVRSTEDKTRPEVAGEDGRVALAVCLAALQSIESGKTEPLA